ncbi:hypothetical protein, partial [Caballeronia mineralivorans]|uniref:hypothetical protein n=1 Tax=Caballeronia mineralivorans TaxID=2010198 RepID=UPI002AFEFD84
PIKNSQREVRCVGRVGIGPIVVSMTYKNKVNFLRQIPAKSPYSIKDCAATPLGTKIVHHDDHSGSVARKTDF